MRSCGIPISVTAHMTFWTFDDEARPQTFSMRFLLSLVWGRVTPVTRVFSRLTTMTRHWSDAPPAKNLSRREHRQRRAAVGRLEDYFHRLLALQLVEVAV